MRKADEVGDAGTGRPNALRAGQKGRAIAATAIAAVFGIAAGFGFHLRENLGVVVEGKLYRSAQPSAALLTRLASEPGIRTVVNLRGDWPDARWHREEAEACRSLGIALHDVPIFTHRLAPMAQLRKLVEIFDSAPGPVLVHCRRGADRTALASALYLALMDGETPDSALRTYQLWHGHTGWARGSSLPHLFDLYKDWLASQGLKHSPRALRRWIAETETIDRYAAEIVCLEPPERIRVGQSPALRFRIVNQSPRPWQAATPIENGVHLFVWTTRASDGTESEARFPLPASRVEPGQSIEIVAALPAFDQEGLVHVAADLHDVDGLKFREMGRGGWHAAMTVERAPAGEQSAANASEPASRLR